MLKSLSVYDFLGCLYHGCNKCFDSNKCNPITGKLNQELYDRTFARLDKIRALGYNIVTIWEHEWNKYYKYAIHYLTDRDLDAVDNYDIYD